MGIVLSGLLAGVVAILVTIAVERFGGVVGGFLGTMPTTIVPASVGIFLASPTPSAFVLAMCAVPIGMLLDTWFLWLWRAIPPVLPAWSSRKRLAVMIAVSLTGWGLASLFAIWGVGELKSLGIGALPLALCLTGLIAIVGVVACLRPFPAPKGTRKVGLFTLMSRGLLAAIAIGVSVWLSQTGGALASGLAATFPAIFLTTMVSLWLAQGEAVPSGAVGPMMLGSSAVPAFGLFAILLFPMMPLPFAVFVTWLCAVVTTTIPASLWLRHRRESSSREVC